jgi:hypothetical protein
MYLLRGVVRGSRLEEDKPIVISDDEDDNSNNGGSENANKRKRIN